MAADYDAPRKDGDDVTEGSVEELKSRRNDAGSTEIEGDEIETTEDFKLSGTGLSKEELTVHAVPKQEGEFTYSHCFLVHHASQLACVDASGFPVCTECEG